MAEPQKFNINGAFIAKLYDKIEDDYSRLQPFRDKRFELLKTYVGKHYSDYGSEKNMPVNFLELIVNILLRQLSANNPRVLCTTHYEQLQSTSYDAELAVNHLIKEIDFRHTMKMAALEGMFSMGVVKVGMNKSASVEIGGILHDVGQPFADTIYLDDLVFDMTVKRWEQINLIGNRFRLRMDHLENCGLYEKSQIKNLTPVEKNPHNEGGDNRTETLSSGATTIEDKLYEYAPDLWEIWLPDENVVVTLPDWQAPHLTKPLREIEWDGPEHGPYHILNFKNVPGNLFPLAPATQWIDLNDYLNGSMRKMIRQSENQKDITTYTGGAEEDANRILEADDQDVIQVNRNEDVVTRKFGGVDPNSFALFLQAKGLLSWFAGNLDLMGGLSPQSDTATQDKLLAQNASMQVADMQDIMVDFTQKIVRDLAWYMWNDPLINIPIVKESHGMKIPETFNFKQTSEGDFFDYNYQIEPYSMQHKSPNMRIQQLDRVLQTLILPALPMLQQEGRTLNFDALIDIYARYQDMPELNQILDYAANPPEQRGPVGDNPHQSPQTTRTYERVNRPGATRQGQDEIMMNSLLGKGQQQSQENSLMRNVG